MTRLFSEGFEYGDSLFWSVLGGTISASTKRSGNYAWRADSSGASKYIPASAELYIRFGWLGGARTDVVMYFYGNTHATHMCNLYFDGGGTEHMTFRTAAGTVLATSNNAITKNVWHLIEFYIKIADAPDGRFTLFVDGISEMTFSGDNKTTAYSNIDRLFVPDAATQFYIDDFACNDTDNSDGKNDNSWCGDEHYELHPANDNGDVNNWTGSDGDKVNNYALVDEVPPTGDTDYVKSDTPAEQDMYKVTAFTDTGKIVTRIWAECRARDSNATAGEIKIGYKTGGSVYLCSTDRVLPSNYARIVGDEALINPVDSGVWEKADLDAIQFVGECE